MKSLRDAEIAPDTRVFYRADYNVPLKDGAVQDDYRIQATYPTLDYLIERGAKVIIGSHLGRPDGQVVEALSLRPVAEVLADHYEDRTVRLAHEVSHEEVEAAIQEMEPGDIIILPNLRFYPGEEANDPQFAGELTQLADIYVDDAFACAHRAHASIVGPAEQLPAYPGFLLEKELQHLGGLLEKPAQPFVVVMGGAKVSDKIGVIEKLGALADRLLIGGAMANTFLLAKGEDIGASKAEPDKVEEAKRLLERFKDKLVLAPDFAKKEEGGSFKYLDIGPEAVALFKEYLGKAKTVFWNGSLGFTEEAPYDTGSREIARCLAELTRQGVTTVIAGGDTVETLTRLELRDAYTFVSTGGGAALELLAGEELPGVTALEGE